MVSLRREAASARAADDSPQRRLGSHYPVAVARLVTVPTDAERPSFPLWERASATLNESPDRLGDFANSV